LHQVKVKWIHPVYWDLPEDTQPSLTGILTHQD
jgi:hypothetical protein